MSGLDVATARLVPVAGAGGWIARVPHAVLFSAAASEEQLNELLQACEGGSSSAEVLGRVVALLSGAPSYDRPSFALVTTAGPDVVVLVHGDQTVALEDASGDHTHLSAGASGAWLTRSLPGVTRIAFGSGHDEDGDGPTNLRAGVIPAAGAVLVPPLTPEAAGVPDGDAALAGDTSGAGAAGSGAAGFGAAGSGAAGSGVLGAGGLVAAGLAAGGLGAAEALAGAGGDLAGPGVSPGTPGVGYGPGGASEAEADGAPDEEPAAARQSAAAGLVAHPPEVQLFDAAAEEELDEPAPEAVSEADPEPVAEEAVAEEAVAEPQPDVDDWISGAGSAEGAGSAGQPEIYPAGGESGGFPAAGETAGEEMGVEASLAAAAAHEPVGAAPGFDPTEMSAAGAAPLDTIPPTEAPEATGPVVAGRFCGRQHFNDPASHYCRICGLPLNPQSTPEVQAERPVLGVLVWDSGDSDQVAGDLIVGRDPHGDPEVSSGQVGGLTPSGHSEGMSRVHAELRLVGWDVTLADRGSTNGTFVWEEENQVWHRLEPGERATLRLGSIIAFGERTATLELPPDA